MGASHTSIPNISRRFLALLLIGALNGAPAGALPESQDLPVDLAPTARISACSHYSADYLPAHVADGVVPEADGRSDLRRAWCVDGTKNRNEGWLRFEWDEPRAIGEVVYYGRTAWMLSECWKDFELQVGDREEPVASGCLEMRHGPQRINFDRVETRTLTLRFKSSWGGQNPGASAVQIFSVSAPASALLVPMPLGDSPELAAKMSSGELGFQQLLVVQRQILEPSHVYTYHNEGFRPGGGLHVFTPGERGGELKALVESPEGQILDCCLSYDGREVLFSWRHSVEDTYHVYRIGVDGTGLARITDGDWHDFNPGWLPDGDIVFLSTRKPAFAYCWTSPVGILHRMDRDGGDVRRLSANYINDFTPSVLNDGQVIYGRWEYVDRPAIPIQSLWTIRPDGTGLAAFYGNRVLSPATFIEPRAIPGSRKVLCTMTAHNGPCRGAIGIIDPTLGVNAQESIRNLTPEVDIGHVDRGDGNRIRGPYESPFPIDERYFLVSRAGTILVRDYAGTEQARLLAPESGIGFYSPIPVRARPEPPVCPSSLPDSSGDTATVFMADVYDGLEPHVARGEVESLCIVQEIEKSELADVRYRAFGFQFPLVSCGATYAPKKIWGYADVDEEGSAAFEVPAGVPLYFMALDREGRALQRMRSFTHLMPGEVQGCRGCHHSRNDNVASARRSTARVESAQALRPPEWGVQGFSYARVVQPVLDRHCVSCHHALEPAGGIDLGGDLTDFFNVSYEVLAREGDRPGANRFTSWIPTYNGQEANILEVTPKAWGSPASPLAELVLSGHPDADGEPRVDVDEEDRRRIFAWIDLNVPYYGTSRSNHLERTGCRQMLPPELESTLALVAVKRCASCHGLDEKDGVRLPRKLWVRVTRPEWNNFLLAPLAREAGGTQACGEAVFASTDDPDYREILDTFEAIHALLEARPRMDQ